MKKAPQDPELELLAKNASCLGTPWVPIYEDDADFGPSHFQTAMCHLIKEPNINSTVILRADILEETSYNGDTPTTIQTSSPELPAFENSSDDDEILCRDLADVKLRTVPLSQSSIPLKPAISYIRRIIPRNPYKDHIINQSCALFSGDDAALVVYVPHIQKQEEVPFYLPPVQAVGILYSKKRISIHYIPFEGDSELRNVVASDRPVRIALRLLQTLNKHSKGAKSGYEKRVNHDLVVPRIAFQNRYIQLKKKYSGPLVSNWVEKTDPKKHVFEDLAVAAFLIELWNARYPEKDFEFRDLGCGNGLLVYILMMEGFQGKGIDARARKSWRSYPKQVQDNLLEQIIIPGVLLKPHPAMARMAPYMTDNGRLFQVPEFHTGDVPLMKYYSAANLLELSTVCTTEQFPSNTFLIGNHSDELTCWMPLLNYPFMVIPCCSHALNGAKVRFTPKKSKDAKAESSAPAKSSKASPVAKKSKASPLAKNSSTYGSLVDHVEDLCHMMGWAAEKEILRIPSTRNAALIGMTKKEAFNNETRECTDMRVLDILASEGGAEGWVENLIDLMSKNPKNH